MPSTPAQFFHVLAAAGDPPLEEAAGRAHAQEPAAASGLRFAPGGPDPRPLSAGDSRSDDGGQAARAGCLLCSGKVYYELLEVRNQRHPDVAILRLGAIASRCRIRS